MKGIASKPVARPTPIDPEPLHSGGGAVLAGAHLDVMAEDRCPRGSADVGCMEPFPEASAPLTVALHDTH